MLFDYDYEIPNKGKFYLNEIIEPSYYERWFNSRNISILNKSLCGNGGTTGFIEYAKRNFNGCLILVPNVSITKSKELQYKSDTDICCVYGGCDTIDPNALVVIATYDQFPKLNQMLLDYGMDLERFWSRRCVVIDEYHKLIDENSFRNICFKVTELIRHTDSSVVLMSATPHMGYVELLRECVKEKKVITYTIKYDTEYDSQLNKRIQVYSIKKDLKSIINQIHITGDRQVCIFFNNVSEIKKILNQIGDNSCEVLCSSSNKNDIGEYYSSEFNPEKKLHFMTSAYFTGHDINTHIDLCIIIGSQQFSYTSYTQRDIKQMLGRFREGVSGICVFGMDRSKDKSDYNKVKNEYDKISKHIKEIEDKGMNYCDFDYSIEWKQVLLNLQDTLDKYKNWNSIDSVCDMFKDMRGDTGVYVVKKCKIEDLVKVKSLKKLSFTAAKTKVIAGETLIYEEYQYNYMLTKYYEVYGADKLMNSSITKIKDWYRISSQTENVDLNILTPEELFDLFGFKNFGVYRASYLIACVRYLGNVCEYDMLPRTFYEVFDSYLILDRLRDREDKNEYMIIKTDNLVKNTQNSNGSTIVNEDFTITKMGIFDRKISYQTEVSNHSYAITVPFNEACDRFKTMKGIPLYDWVNEDKTTRLPLRKKDMDWTNIKSFKQTKISEMYKVSDKRYRYCKSQMDRIDHIIVDIDSGVKYSDFHKQYQDLTYIAYPTISNLTPDWTKFRVIFPLQHTLLLKGEYNAQVLKSVRNMVCYYEDHQHILYSYVNKEDFEQRVENEGRLLNISQDLVDSITIAITNNKEFIPQKFNKSEVSLSSNVSVWTLDQAKDYFNLSKEKPEEGARHKALYIIKNRLCENDRRDFERWLHDTYGSHYLPKWKSHRVVRKV